MKKIVLIIFLLGFINQLARAQGVNEDVVQKLNSLWVNFLADGSLLSVG